ncbi:hypothetical protein HBI04_020530 [Parastagonospora nodorum]|nr:hypothetical protein HBH49_016230 [Parastagonospora nodorum]KAH4283234.1 hypothetical protein HBI04_020530 [Parastagonospora nodorum]KAH5519288.1 hypothetical protein HBI29_070090 [Parastagonospora nodorum]
MRIRCTVYKNFHWTIATIDKLSPRPMATNTTYIPPTSPVSSSWSKEAILALVTIITSLVMSGLGLLFKHRLKTFFPPRLKRHRSLRATQDIELAYGSHADTSCEWVDIERIRRYQQDTYTSLLHTRHGPDGSQM